MNRIERMVYDRLKRFPKVKIFVRNFYQAIFSLLPKEDEFSLNPIVVREGYFYGFHDCSPFSSDDSKLLAHKTISDHFIPSDGDRIDVATDFRISVVQTSCLGYNRCMELAQRIKTAMD